MPHNGGCWCIMKDQCVCLICSPDAYADNRFLVGACLLLATKVRLRQDPIDLQELTPVASRSVKRRVLCGAWSMCSTQPCSTRPSRWALAR